MKHILGWNEWHIHPFTYLYVFVFFLNGSLDHYLSALFIVCFHEMFHYVFAKKYQFEVEKVEVLPFGAFLSLQDYGMHHVIEEYIVIIAGLSSHFFLYLFFTFFMDMEYLHTLNRLVFFFNILPIYPLDGSKLVLLTLSLFMDYQRAIQFQIKLSIFSLCVLMTLQPNIGYLIVYLYLIYINYSYIKEYRYYLIRLFLQRKDNPLYQKIKINKKWKWYRPYHNIYFFNQHYYDENQMLEKLIRGLKNNVK